MIREGLVYCKEEKGLSQIASTHLILLVSFYTSWKYQKTRSLLMFSEGKERTQWHENELIDLQSKTIILLGWNQFYQRFWRRCFPVNFAKFLRTYFWQNSSEWLLLYFDSEPDVAMATSCQAHDKSN